MLKNNPSKIIVSGSLAYDQIMDFPGYFSDHILPTAIHNLNLSFFVNDLRQSYGGTAGNIAYNLSLLQEQPILLGVAGNDFEDYDKFLRSHKIDLSHLKIYQRERSAAAYLITDQGDNQIGAFYPGPLPKNYAFITASKLKKIDLAIIAPDDKDRMLAYARAYKIKKIPYIFDPGQALIAFSAVELKRAITRAQILIGNDYEIKLILNKLKIKRQQLIKLVDILVITQGSQGSKIYQDHNKIIIKPTKAKNTSDPTGAGDAYRAGLIKGLIRGYNLKTCGQIASLVAVYTVEKFGTQTHHFTLKEFIIRYYQNYHEKLVL